MRDCCWKRDRSRPCYGPFSGHDLKPGSPLLDPKAGVSSDELRD